MLETDRLLLRPWRMADATVQRELWATVRSWNTASLRVLAKVGFGLTDRVEPDEVHGDTLFTMIRL